jgi:hypothetical protein
LARFTRIFRRPRRRRRSVSIPSTTSRSSPRARCYC